MVGGTSTPETSDTVQLVAVNIVVLVALGLFLSRDFQQQKKEKAIIEREESLSELKVG